MNIKIDARLAIEMLEDGLPDIPGWKGLFGVGKGWGNISSKWYGYDYAGTYLNETSE